MSEDRYEPSAVNREFARIMFDMYMAMIKEGFDRRDALEIIKGVIAANISNG